MDRATLEAAVAGVRVWQRGDQRAPHKPLLLLLALGRVVHGAPRLMRYADVDEVLGRLLRDFGPARSAVHPEYPFWRLQNDGLWEVSTTGPMRVREGNSDPSRHELLSRDGQSGFTEAVVKPLATLPELWTLDRPIGRQLGKQWLQRFRVGLRAFARIWRSLTSRRQRRQPASGMYGKPLRQT